MPITYVLIGGNQDAKQGVHIQFFIIKIYDYECLDKKFPLVTENIFHIRLNTVNCPRSYA